MRQQASHSEAMMVIDYYSIFSECLGVGDKYIHVENGGDYFTKREGDALKIYFEWSDGKEDWKNNFDFPARPYKSMNHLWFCHRGFLKVWKSIEPHVSADIADPSVRTIEVVGYSHGAAIALLCYEYCIFHRPDAVVRGFGFGCPRVFWGYIPKAVKARFKGFKVVRNGNDIVTHVPPSLFGFRHVSEIVKIGKTNPVRDHYPEKYLTHMEDTYGTH